jgi:hypothetical protein
VLLLKQFYFTFILFLLFIFPAQAQLTDTIGIRADTIISTPPVTATSPLDKLLAENKFLNHDARSVSQVERPRKKDNETEIFYLIAGLLFLFGIIKTVYGRYFSTLFRVFFNSSLRQSQLTDQLVQAKLPSLFFNIVFVLSGGLYVYLLLQRISNESNSIKWLYLMGCVAAFIIVYFIKYFSVKFIGWVSGLNAEADTYIFIVFLINKIIGICLLPIIVVVAFADPIITNAVLVMSIVFIGVMLLFRFIRSFSLLQHKLKISRFHFLLYIFSLEILPLILIYKAVELFISKKL